MRSKVLLFAAVSILVASSLVQASTDATTLLGQFPDPRQFEVGSRQWLKAVEALKYRPLVSQSLIDNCPHSFDVLHYNVTLFVDTDIEEISGNTVVTAMSEVSSLTSIDLDLAVLTVDSVLSETGSPLTFTHIDSVLSIDLPQAYSSGDTFSVQVFYHGHPGNEGPDGFGGFYFAGTPIMAFQMGVGLEADPPSMGKFWIPCWDWPCDKATVEYHITVPGTGKKVVCNGILTGSEIDTVASTATYHWVETHQIAPHLMTVHARRYKELIDSTYDWIHYWVFPPDEEDAKIHFQNVDVMMDGFIERFGPYPFSKFGYAMATKGDMEHQTCVTHVARVVQPNHLYDWLLAHEMSHQWWGDCVSVNDWRDIWLSEGFATYCEAIYQEHAYGMDAYHDYIERNLMNPVFSSGENFPIYDPDYLWGTTVYEKGGCVLHMLRHVLGDSLFYEALATYRANHEYGNATTPEFQQDVESVYGQSLDWFFNEWIYDVGWPVYEYSWHADSQGDSFALNLVIDQVQTNGPIFTMPVDVKVRMATGDSLIEVVWVDEAHEEYLFTYADEPVGIELDPDNWILNEAQEVPYAGIDREPSELELALRVEGTNPVLGTMTISYSVPGTQRVRIQIFDTQGRLVKTLLDDVVPAGGYDLSWDRRNVDGAKLAPGVYFVRLSATSGTRTIPLVYLQ